MKRGRGQRRGRWRKELHRDHGPERRKEEEAGRGSRGGDGGRGEAWRRAWPLPLPTTPPSPAALDSQNFFILLRETQPNHFYVPPCFKLLPLIHPPSIHHPSIPRQAGHASQDLPEAGGRPAVSGKNRTSSPCPPHQEVTHHRLFTVTKIKAELKSPGS